MIRWLILFMLITTPLFASDVVCYDDLATPEHVTSYQRSVNTPDFIGLPCLVNPDLTAVSALARKYWKHSSGSIVPMTQGERDAVDAAQAAAEDAAMRTSAKAQLDGQTSIGQNKRCQLQVLAREIDILRQWTLDFKAEVAAATNLGNLQSRVANLSDLPKRDDPPGTAITLFKNAVNKCIDDGDVDE